MKNTNKKGFTIVELVIVIAVIAILAAVLIPTFASILNKASLSNDQTAISMINTNLKIAFPANDPKNAGDAIQGLYSLGFSAEKLVAYTSGYYYLYDKADNMFYLSDKEGNIVFPEEKADKSNMWGLYRDGGENDKVAGVNNYVFLSSPSNHYNYASAFHEGIYTLDLNKLPLVYSTAYESTKESEQSYESNDENITIINGAIAVADSGYKGTDGATVKKYTLADRDLCVYGNYNNTHPGAENMVATNGTLVFEKYSFVGDGDTVTLQTAYTNIDSYVNEGRDGVLDGERPVTPVTELIFTDCLFADYSSFSPFGLMPENNNVNSKIVSLKFENCTFVNAGTAIAANTKSNRTVIEITGCEFINCKAGISIRDPKEGTVISNNTFNIVGPNDETYGQAVQFYSVKTPVGETTPVVTISNNKIVCAKSFVRLYAVKNGILSSEWNKYVKFENNTYPSDLIKVVLTDSDSAHKAALEALIK